MNKTEILAAHANRFYLGREDAGVAPISDAEYDALVKEWEAETGKSVKTLVAWDADAKVQREPIDHLEKDSYMPDEIAETIKADFEGKDFIINYKYDGCSIEAVYSPEGRLQQILGTPDEEFGFIRTDKFWNFFPHQVTPGIHRLLGEVLVSTENYGQLARNKANGLCNSKYLAEDIEREALVRAYNIIFYDKQWDFKRLVAELDKLPVITRVVEGKTVAVFDVAERLTLKDLSGSPLITEKDEYKGVTPSKLQVDGYVVYSQESIFAYKMYYTEYQDIRVTNLDWGYNWANGSYIPTLEFDTVKLNDKSTSRCSTGGVPNLISNKMGVGALVRVIMSGGTIPKVIKVLEPSENYEFPTCECGHQLSEQDIMGSVLKCNNPVCVRKLATIYEEIGSFWNLPRIQETEESWPTWTNEEGKTWETVLNEDIFFPIRLLHVDRFKPENKFKQVNPLELICRMVDSVNSKGFSEENLRGQLSALGVEDIEQAVSCVMFYKEQHTDESFDRAVNVLVELTPQQSSEVEENYLKEILAFLQAPSKEALQLILSKYFTMSGLQKRNADLNIDAVVEGVKTWPSKLS